MPTTVPFHPIVDVLPREQPGMYLSEQTAGSLIRNMYRIYFKNFWVFLAIQLATVYPLMVMQVYGAMRDNQGWQIAGQVLQLLLFVPSFAATSIAVSHISFSGTGSARAALRRGFSLVTWQVYVTWFLTALVLVGGFLLLIVPGVIFSAWYQFAPLITVVEGASGRRALARSRELGRGYYRRNLGVLLLAALAMIVPYYLVVMVTAVVAAFATAPLGEIAAAAVISVAAVIGPQLSIIALVLLYFDMRVRKEPVDSMMLLEELQSDDIHGRRPR